MLVAAASLAVLSTAASAASIDFTFDVAGSGVTLTPQGGWGSGCTGAGDCVSAGLASGFGSPLTISVEEGWENRYTFDFLSFEGNGWGLYENYSVTATLAFTDPSEATTSSGGNGGVLAVANGYITGGWLFWNDVPTTVTLLNGSEILDRLRGWHRPLRRQLDHHLGDDQGQVGRDAAGRRSGSSAGRRPAARRRHRHADRAASPQVGLTPRRLRTA